MGGPPIHSMDSLEAASGKRTLRARGGPAGINHTHESLTTDTKFNELANIAIECGSSLDADQAGPRVPRGSRGSIFAGAVAPVRAGRIPVDEEAERCKVMKENKVSSKVITEYKNIMGPIEDHEEYSNILKVADKIVTLALAARIGLRMSGPAIVLAVRKAADLIDVTSPKGGEES